MEHQVQKLLDSLLGRGIPCSFANDKNAAKAEVLKLINDNSTVGIGGSMTIKQLELGKPLLDKGCEIFWHWEAKDASEADHMRRQAMVAHYYLCSTNAVTLDGRLVNIDGTGNRVAAMVFGPRKVIIVAGINKIADDYESAMDRIKTEACPPNARRLKKDTPCAALDECTDCNSPDRMCNVTTIIEGKPNQVDMHVLIVGEPMGY
jgi:hypothetical protein